MRRIALVTALLAGCQPGSFTFGNGGPGDDDSGPDPDPDVDAGPPSPQPDAAPPGDGRALGAAAVYKFIGGAGTTVRDVSGVDPLLDLTIQDPDKALWVADGLQVSGPTIVSSLGPATKIHDQCLASNAITIEAWITNATVEPQLVPPRIVTLSADAVTRNFSLIQLNGTDYELRLRTSQTDLNGIPSVLAPAAATTAPQHVVYTRGQAGQAMFYVDGAPLPPAQVPGDFANWDPGYSFALANELTGDRPWLGTLHLVAVYCRELSADEVAQNYAAGYAP